MLPRGRHPVLDQDQAKEVVMEYSATPVSFSEAKWTREIINSYSEAPLFRDLPRQCVQTLLQTASVQEFEHGKMLVQQGDKPSHLYFILKGAVKTLQYNEDGEEAVMRMLKKTDTFMEAAIFMGAHSPVNAQIIDDARILMIPANVVKAQIMMNNQFARNLLEIVSAHYKDAMNQITSIMLKTPVQRVGHYFLKLHIEQSSTLLEIKLPFKKSLIAHHLGMQPETFSRALQQIKKSGVDIDGETITLKDSFSLCHFCDLDIAYDCNRCETEECPSCED
jgi:CRP/FNR family transcriptional regulator, dissimilatory nitrate respiration regulator